MGAALAVTLRTEVALACRILAQAGHGDLTLGHISARAHGARTYWVKRAARGLDEIRPSDVVLVDFAGKRLRGTGAVHGELVIHGAIYQARPDVGCVIHTHPFYATAFSALDAPLELLLQDSVILAGSVARFSATPELLITPEQGTSLARALGDARAVLLRHHGVVVVGPTVPEAVLTALALERAAKAQLLLAPLGAPKGIEPAQARAMAHGFESSASRTQGLWEYLVRSLPSIPGGKKG
jgi:L-fuculose-phosphate aldolase